MKLKLILSTVVLAVVMFGNSPAARAQSSISQGQFNSAQTSSLWLFTWGSDASLLFKTNDVSTGATINPQMIAGGATYTSDVWTMNLTFNSGNVSITANSAQGGPGLFWNASSSFSSSAPITSLLFGTAYQADNGESMSVSSILVNGVPVSETTLANGSQNFSGLEVDYGSAITSLQYDLTIDTPTTWERQNPGGPPFGPALADTLIIPGVTSTPEPSTMALLGVGILAFLKFRKKC